MKLLTSYVFQPRAGWLWAPRLGVIFGSLGFSVAIVTLESAGVPACSCRPWASPPWSPAASGWGSAGVRKRASGRQERSRARVEEGDEVLAALGLSPKQTSAEFQVFANHGARLLVHARHDRPDDGARRARAPARRAVAAILESGERFDIPIVRRKNMSYDAERIAQAALIARAKESHRADPERRPLGEIVENPAAEVTARAGAAAMLAEEASGEDRARLRVAADTCAGAAPPRRARQGGERRGRDGRPRRRRRHADRRSPRRAPSGRIKRLDEREAARPARRQDV